MTLALADVAPPRAIFSPCERYRYRLWRDVLPAVPGAGRSLVFVMLNPSTADSEKDDPTVRRCIGFARTWGWSRLVVVNIFALRSTDPAALYGADDPVGPSNDFHLLQVAAEAGKIVCAWGNHGAYRGRGAFVLNMLSPYHPECFTLTKELSPVHPLYQSADARTVPLPRVG